MRRAILDIGTNTILLLIAEESPLTVLADRARIVRLGQDVDRTGRLAKGAIERALAALREYEQEIWALKAKPSAIATQALREVENGDDFLAPARAILKCDVEVIDGEREAALSFRAVRESFQELTDVIVVDIGGGSTELVVGRSGQIESKTSVPLGSVRLTERFMKHDPPATDEIDTATRFIDQVLPPLPRGLPLVGIAGTVTTLGAMHAGIDPYDPERVHGMELSREAVAAQINRLRDLPLAGRKRLPGLSPERADVILAGALILLRVMDRLEAPTVRISDRGIRWGLLYEQMGSRGSPAP